MFGISRYNYEAFTREMLRKEMAQQNRGPKPGERAPEFEIESVEGETIRLSDYLGEKNVVLTFGSATCPMTAGSISGMNDLSAEYNGDDVQFLFVYVREAHPGDALPAHRSMEEKMRAARLLRQEEEIDMPVLVDDLRGSLHRKYGKLPNPTFIIDKSGRIAFRALWTRPGVVEDALGELLERQRDRGVEHAVVNGGEDRSLPRYYALVHAYRALERGGEKAKKDFRRALGVRGRVALASSRMADPLVMNPGKALAAAAITGGVITAGLLAGRKLREKRFSNKRPYNIYEGAQYRTGTKTGTDYEVGI